MGPTDLVVQSNKCTPFFQAFRSEVVLPTELEYGSPRTEAYEGEWATTDALLSIDLLDEI